MHPAFYEERVTQYPIEHLSLYETTKKEATPDPHGVFIS
jgi:hypothetical protein